MFDLKYIEHWIEENRSQLNALANQLFQHPEMAEREYFACSTLTCYLEQHGFAVQESIEGLDTAFIARWGSRGPNIGLLVEYDALPNSYQPVSTKQYVSPDQPGHACGHHLIGAVSVVAAAAVKAISQELCIPLRLTVYGCPAEETMKGKVVLAQQGVFSDLDAAVCWHPEDFNGAVAYRCKAIDIVHYRFTGISAHAAQAPHMGRSALDACELMNVGANYLREHTEPGCSFHYAYLDAPSAPNLVPSHAALIYYVRGKRASQVQALSQRLSDIAHGAALMAGVSVQENTVISVPETRPSLPLTRFASNVMANLQMDSFSEEDRQFARELLTNSHLPCPPSPLSEEVRIYDGQIEQRNGSSDVAAVSKLVPTVILRNTCVPAGIPQHHWAFAASCGSHIGLRGSANGVRTLTALILSMADTPEILAEAWRCFSEAEPDGQNNQICQN